MQQRIVELSPIVEIDRLFWVILVAPVDHEVSFFRQCGPLPYTILPTLPLNTISLYSRCFYFILKIRMEKEIQCAYSDLYC